MPYGEHLGRVLQDFGSCSCGNGSTFKVLDSTRSLVLNINGRWTKTGACVAYSCSKTPLHMDVDISVSSLDTSITIPRFLVKDPNDSNANPFGMQVYSQMDCTLKAILLGFMIDIVSSNQTVLTKSTKIDSFESFKVFHLLRRQHTCSWSKLHWRKQWTWTDENPLQLLRTLIVYWMRVLLLSFFSFCPSYCPCSCFCYSKMRGLPLHLK